MTPQPRWLNKSTILAIHGALLSEHGGRNGLRDEGLLESALANPRNRQVYSKADLFDLAAAYAYALIRNHPFQDGDKRAALVAAGVFLEWNGKILKASEADAVVATLALAGRKLDQTEFAAWLRMSSGDLS